MSSPSDLSNARSIERLIEVYQRGLTISRATGVSFEHVFEIVTESRYGRPISNSTHKHARLTNRPARDPAARTR